MILELKKKINEAENRLCNIDNKHEKINYLFGLEHELEQIIRKEIKNIEINYGLSEYLKKYDLEYKTYEDYLNKYKKDSLDNEDLYELASDYKEYKVFDGYKHFVQEILSKMDMESDEYENDIFYIRPYNWMADIYGGCNCGLEDKVNEIYESLDDSDENKEDICAKGFHGKSCSEWNIVFYYKPTGLKVKMEYNAPIFERSISNHPLNENILRGILNHCKNSVKNRSR